MKNFLINIRSILGRIFLWQSLIPKQCQRLFGSGYPLQSVIALKYEAIRSNLSNRSRLHLFTHTNSNDKVSISNLT